ncbi:DNA polymerase III subunit gamma/tau [Buchnera aphidicola (Melanaphis sacchari)]|uniref:DNA polymerase III subunit gamma/tau n=1 Tax=Buchnera aphidicola (Melanaphis sacchari) TaxID=2173854 RepID=A0A2U8DEQ7_9GAMM|nr:DNA polymerase III subunit gamma/tau [Buchnera aphidicola]AWH90330.1 DNA polymerase III subunit gamma/tau [Buchnera aphidicola (Melanaphis sacchari)]
MIYQILARKWRPQSFDDIIGQKHIVQSISNGFSLGRIHHAWILSGTRGIGKTTIARILAKSLNCQMGVTSNACRKCNNCQEIEKGKSLDFIEIDAASRTKVEEMREILDNVHYPPIKSRFKIYLIDEVHMLSRHSFNALLKTLEEPPKHIKFILATTNIEKVPDTIISRCLYFQLNILSEDNIFHTLVLILKEECIKYEKEAIQTISYHSQGSMRDALNLLENAINSSYNYIKLKNINEMLGLPNKKNIFLLTKFLFKKDSRKIIFLLNKISSIGVDWENILTEVLRFLHHIAMIKLYPKTWNNKFFQNTEKEQEIKKIAENNDIKNIQICYQILLNGRKKLIFSPSYKIGVEMTFLEAIEKIKNKNIF